MTAMIEWHDDAVCTVARFPRPQVARSAGKECHAIYSMAPPGHRCALSTLAPKTETVHLWGFGSWAPSPWEVIVHFARGPACAKRRPSPRTTAFLLACFSLTALFINRPALELHAHTDYRSSVSPLLSTIFSYLRPNPPHPSLFIPYPSSPHHLFILSQPPSHPHERQLCAPYKNGELEVFLLIGISLLISGAV